MNSLISNRTILACFAVFTLLLLASPAAVYAETWNITGNVNATVTKTHTAEGVTFTIVITTAGPHYGVGIVLATDGKAFQVWYREYATPYGFYYQDYTGTGWCGFGGAEVPFSRMPGFSGVGSFDTNTFTITVPWSALGGCGKPFYFAMQVRTNLINSWPTAAGVPNIWCNYQTNGVSNYASQDLPECPPVGGTVMPSPVSGLLALLPWLLLAVVAVGAGAYAMRKRYAAPFLTRIR